MKERPILFSAPMVRALLDGSKTQTRRAFTVQPPPGVRVAIVNNTTQRYGGPGDRLWVRETFRLVEESDPFPPRATSMANRAWYEADAPHQPGFGKARPSIHMPRWASRILLEIIEVRVERLQSISRDDAIAEGIEPVGARWRNYAFPTEDGEAWEFPQNSFGSLWASINGEALWDSNPWVWAITFRRITP